jgi:hypothetical protein
MPAVAACDIDLIRVREAIRVAVCRDDPQDDPLALANEGPIQVKVCRSRPGKCARKAGVTQQLLDRLFGQRGLLM